MPESERKKTVDKIVKLIGVPGGLGLAASVQMLMSGNIQGALLTGGLSILVVIGAIAHRFLSSLINKTLDKIEEKLSNTEEPLAEWFVNQLIKFWWEINPSFKKAYYASLVESIEEFRVEGYRTYLPALDLENVYVSLRVRIETPDKANTVIIPNSREQEGREIWEFLQKSKLKEFKSYRRLAILGSPGSGKTTLLKYITLTYTNNNWREHKVPKYIPVLLYLRDIRHEIVSENPPDLIELILKHIKNPSAEPSLEPPPAWLKDQIKIGKCLVMLDGLDEVANIAEREKVRDWVDKQMKKYSKTPFILTSRPYGYWKYPRSFTL
jgi:hypothetical protein